MNDYDSTELVIVLHKINDNLTFIAQTISLLEKRMN